LQLNPLKKATLFAAKFTIFHQFKIIPPASFDDITRTNTPALDMTALSGKTSKMRHCMP
jgi:hypothetical protein